jgi:hypothetical protein
MTSKERVLTTLEGKIPDHVPYGEFAIDFDTVRKILGRESYLKDHIELHEKLEVDIITFPMAAWEIPSETDEAPPKKSTETPEKINMAGFLNMQRQLTSLPKRELTPGFLHRNWLRCLSIDSTDRSYGHLLAQKKV